MNGVRRLTEEEAAAVAAAGVCLVINVRLLMKCCVGMRAACEVSLIEV